jgi:diazepam-binding inhibitor (GABA receptor modulating acyl-CoA-binding protein)
MTTFEEATIRVGNCQNIPVPDLLRLYALYKTSTVGPNTTNRPNIFNLSSSAKWTAWKDSSYLSKEQAQIQYVELSMKYIHSSSDLVTHKQFAVNVSKLENNSSAISYFISLTVATKQKQSTIGLKKGISK